MMRGLNPFDSERTHAYVALLEGVSWDFGRYREQAGAKNRVWGGTEYELTSWVVLTWGRRLGTAGVRHG